MCCRVGRGSGVRSLFSDEFEGLVVGWSAASIRRLSMRTGDLLPGDSLDGAEDTVNMPAASEPETFRHDLATTRAVTT